LVTLDETPSVDIDHHTPISAFTSQQIKAAYSLPKSIDHVTSISDFFRGKLADESGLLAIGVAPNETIYHG